MPPQSLIIEQIRSNAGESYINEFVCKKNPVLEIDNIAGTQNITESEICTDNCIIIPEGILSRFFFCNLSLILLPPDSLGLNLL